MDIISRSKAVTICIVLILTLLTVSCDGGGLMENINTKITDNIKAVSVFNGVVGQDGAISGDYMLRFENDATCTVYLLTSNEQIAQFTLDKADIMKPHCNTVCFGGEYFEDGDEFPLLYINVYNNYASEEDRREGVCCVYRIQRDGTLFSSTLVQLIKIGFVDDIELWKSQPDNSDRRPYGNFITDNERNRLYVYVMRDKTWKTRYFEFEMPRLSDGVYDEKYGVNTVILSSEDIKTQFDLGYSNYVQGGCARDGILYSLEGGTVKGPESKVPPRLKVIDMKKQALLSTVELHSFGLSIEPELIDFYGDTLYYMDSSGAVYTIEFE